MDARFISDTLLPVLRAGLGLASEPPAAEPDLALLRTVGKEQSLLPLLSEGLHRLGIEGPGAEAVREGAMNDLYLFEQRDYALGQIRACLERTQLDYVLLKGAVLRELYPEPWMRTSCDVDVLVREEVLERALAALEQETAFRTQKREYHDVSLRAGHIQLELHFNIKEDMPQTDGLLSRVWDYAWQTPDPHRFALSPEFQLFHVIAHMAYHFVNGGLGLRAYCDLWLLRHRTQYEEAALRSMCEKCGLLRFYEACTELSEVWLSGQAHSELTRQLEQYCFSGGVFGSAQNAMLSRQREHRGAAYLLRRGFLPRKNLEEAYPNLKKHPLLLPFYQLRRWLTLFTGKRRRLQRELKLLRETSDAQIDSFDRLMKRVGL